MRKESKYKNWKKGIIIILVLLCILALGIGVWKSRKTEQITMVEGVEKQQATEAVYIGTAEELAQFRDEWNAGNKTNTTVYLTNNIDLSNYSNWIPILSFNGTFDGQGYVISHMTIQSSEDGMGLFKSISQSTVIKNLGITNSSITGANYVGGFVGYNTTASSQIQNCYIINSSISGEKAVGGIAGGEQITIRNCYSNATINGNTRVGGIIGDLGEGLVEYCYNKGEVAGISDVGGIAGIQVSPIIQYCYNIGTITGSSNVGSIAGNWDSEGYCISNYYLETCVADTYAVAKTSSYMKTQAFITDLGGSDYWTFVSGKNDGYPVLFWETTLEPPTISVEGSTLNSSTGWYTAVPELVKVTNSSTYMYIYVYRNGTLLWDDESHESTAASWGFYPIEAEYEVQAYSRNEYGQTSETVTEIIKIDATAPAITLSTNSNTTWGTAKSVTVTLGDSVSGIASGANIKYGWSTSATVQPTSYTTASLSYTEGATSVQFTATGSGLTGQYYLWVVPTTLKDVAGNSLTTNTVSTGKFYFDNTAPTKTAPIARATTNSITVTNQQTDSHSGIASVQYAIYQNGTWSSYQSSNSFNNLEENATYLVKTKTTDKVGNSSESNTFSITTASSTLYIGTAEELVKFRDEYVGSYIYQHATVYLTADIDLSGYPNWTPINLETFEGTFDGQGHIITNITINTDGSAGLFVNTVYGNVIPTIKNLGITNSSIKGGDYVAGFVGGGENSSANIYNCYITNSTVSGNNYVGGIMAYGNEGEIKYCYNAATVSGEKYIGGIIGGWSSVGVSNCYNVGRVNGTSNVGSIVGDSYFDNGSNNYYLEGLAEDTSAISKTSEYMKTEDFIKDLGGSEYWQLTNPTSDDEDIQYIIDRCKSKINYQSYDYPTLTWQKSPNVDPTISVTSGTLGNNEYYTSNVTVEIDLEEEILDGAKLFYEYYDETADIINPILINSVPSNFELTVELKEYDIVAIYGYDNGLFSAATKTIKIDKTAPTTIAPTAVSTTNSITVTSKQTDGASGIANIEYSIYKNGTWSTYQSRNVFSGLEHSTEYKVKTRATDNAGNSSESAELSITTQTLTAGNLTLKLNNASGKEYTSGNWTNQNVYATLTSGNAGTTTYASKVGSSQQVDSTSSATTISAEGTTTLVVTTTDGTNRLTKEYVIKIDKTAPTGQEIKINGNTVSNNTEDNPYYYNDKVTFDYISGTDSLSGISENMIACEIDSGDGWDEIPLEEVLDYSYYKMRISVYSYDNAGNDSKSEYIYFRIDSVDPTQVAPTAASTTNSITVTNEQIDSESGIASVEYAIYKDGAWSTYQSSNVFSGLTHNTTYKVKTKTTDNVGNSSESQETTITTKTLTVGSLTLKQNNASGASYTAGNWTNQNVYVTLTAGNAGTTTYASVAGSSQEVASTTSATTIIAEGTTTLRVTTTDGTNTVTKDYVIKIDKTAPSITTVTQSPTTATNGRVTLTINGAQDSGVGLHSTAYSFDNGATWQTSASKTYDRNTSGIIVQVKDALGNTYTYETTINITNIDKTVPTCIITTDQTSDPTNSSSITYTFTFSEEVTGFTSDDIEVTNGTKGTFSGSGKVYILVVTNSGSCTQTVSIAADVCTDSAGNGNTAAEKSITIDRSSLTAMISANPAANPTNSSSITYTFTFNKEVTGFNSEDIEVTNGTKGTFNGSGTTYTLVVTNSGSCTQTVSITANVCTDSAGNGNAAASKSVTIDRTAPTCTITASPSTSPTNSSSITYTFTFSEEVSEFTAEDITVANGTKGAFSGSGTTYTLVVTNSGSCTQTVSIAANVCTDSAGNGNTTASKSITIDRTAPTITSVTKTPENWTNGDVTLTVNGAADSVAGLAVEAYSFNGGSTWQRSASMTYSVNTSNIVIKVRDALGNIYTHETVNITNIDKTNPTTAVPTAASTTNSITVNNQQTDTGSGIAKVEYAIYKEGGWSSYQSSNVFSGLNHNTEYKVKTKTTDNAGNSSESLELSITTKELTIGSLVLTLNNADGEEYNSGNWTNQNVYASLTAGSVGSTTYASKTGSSQTVESTTSATTISTEGTTTLVVTTTDGTNTLTKEYTIKIDKTNPTQLVPTATVTTNSVTVNNQQTDVLSGIAKVEYAIYKEGQWSEYQDSNVFSGLNHNTEYKVKTKTTDNAGNSSESTELSIKTDTLTIGSLTLKLNNESGEDYTSGTWTNQNVYVSLNQGSSGSTTYASKAGSSQTIGETSSPATVTTEGITTLVVTTVDGTNTETKEYEIKIDKTPPTTIVPTAVSTTNSITVTNQQTDVLSGIAKVEYAIYKEGQWSEYQDSNVFSGLNHNTEYKVKTKTTDNAENSSESTELGIKTDTLTIGSLTLKLNNASGEDYTSGTWTNQNVYVSLNQGSSGSTTYASKTGSSQTVESTTSATTITAEGTTTLVVTTVDGTNTETKEYEIKIDKTPPTITNVEGNPDTWTNKEVVLTVNGAKDVGVGLNEEAYSFDNGATWQEEASKTYVENTNNIVIKVRDAIGNVYTHQAINITKIDTTNPSTELPTAVATSNTITVTNQQEDKESGIANVEYAIYKDGGWSTYQSSNVFSGLEHNNEYQVKTKTTDNAGNSSESETLSITTKELTEGSLVLTLNDAQGAEYHSGDWTNQNVYVALVEGNAGSTTYASKTGSSQTIKETSSPITVTAEGTTTLVVTTTDGTNTLTKEYTIKIDKTAPSIGSITKSIEEWTKETVTVSINGATDTGSGLHAMAYSFDNGNTWQTELSKTYNTNTSDIIVKVRDAVGNIYTHDGINITNIDTTLPTITVPTVNATTNSITVTNQQEDNESGIASVEYAIYKEGQWSNYQTNNVFTELTHNTEYKVKTKTTDKAGNSSESEELNVTTNELTVGTLSMKLNNADGAEYNSGSWTNQNVYVTLIAGNAGSTTYASKTGSSQTVESTSSATTISTEGTTTLVVTTSDGTNVVTREFVIKIDKVAPSAPTLKIVNARSGNNGWYINNVEIELIPGLEEKSEVAKNTVIVNGRAEQEVSENIIATEDGNYEMIGYTYDAAGNRSEASNVLTFKQDTQGPIMNVKVSNIKTNCITVDASQSKDEVSGIVSYAYYVNDKLAYESAESTYTIEGLTDDTEYSITVKATDEAGNISTSEVIVSKTQKVPDAQENEGNIRWTDFKWENTEASVRIETDTEFTIQYQVNGVEENAWIEGDIVTGLKHSDVIYARLTDGINAGEYTSYEVFDRQKPEMPSMEIIEGEEISYHVYSGEVKIKITQGKDAESGTQKTIYTINGESTEIIEDSIISLKNNGTYTIKAHSVDYGNNSSEEITLSIRIQTKEEKYFTSDIYAIEEENLCITKISPSTQYAEFQKHIFTNMEYTVFEENGTELQQETLVKTGDILDVEGKRYTLIVIGDINEDGECDISDLSKLKKHIIQEEIQTGITERAADVSLDGEADITDLSRMVRYIIGLIVL